MFHVELNRGKPLNTGRDVIQYIPIDCELNYGNFPLFFGKRLFVVKSES